MDIKLYIRAQWDRVAACALVAVGALALFVGWIGVSETAISAEQIPYVISGGLGGIALLGVGATLWLSADLRDEWRKLDRSERILDDVAARLASALQRQDQDDEAARLPSDGVEASAAPGGDRPDTATAREVAVAPHRTGRGSVSADANQSAQTATRSSSARSATQGSPRRRAAGRTISDEVSE